MTYTTLKYEGIIINLLTVSINSGPTISEKSINSGPTIKKYNNTNDPMIPPKKIKNLRNDLNFVFRNFLSTLFPTK